MITLQTTSWRDGQQIAHSRDRFADANDARAELIEYDLRFGARVVRDDPQRGALALEAEIGPHHRERRLYEGAPKDMKTLFRTVRQFRHMVTEHNAEADLDAIASAALDADADQKCLLPVIERVQHGQAHDIYQRT